MQCNIDGDILLYSVGHATDDRYYTIEGTKERFSYKADALAYCSTHDINPTKIVFNRIPAPEAFYYHGLKQKIQSILNACECSEYRIFLTGDNNFRKELAVTHPYKGNRKSEDKPLLYQEMKAYLMRDPCTIVAEECEADDYLGCYRTENTILCSTDKDLDQIPGFHYNFTNNEMYYIPEEYGTRFLYQQILTGDSTDNIHGIKGVGPKKAQKILQGCESTQDYLRVVGLQYAIHFDDPEDYLWEVTGLIQIAQSFDDILAPGQRALGEMYADSNNILQE